MDTTILTNQNERTGTKGWTIALWAAQVLLAAMFMMSGVMKLVTPMAQLAAQSPLPEFLVRFIGLSEVAGSLGLILPAILKIRPRLTVLSAALLTLVMILGMLFHLVRGEGQGVIVTLVIAAITSFVVWGRSVKAPITARS